MPKVKRHILVVEDDAVLGGALRQRLKLEGFAVEWVTSCEGALQALRRGQPDFILSDLVLPDGSGEDLFRRVQEYLGRTPIVFMTAFAEVEQAVRLVKAGADDYLEKPFDMEGLVARLHSVLETQGGTTADGFLALGPTTRTLRQQLADAARSDLPVLLIGETGTGKERAARLLHTLSTRAQEPFVAVNCGAIPQELLESQFFGHERGAFTGAAQAHIGFFEESGKGTLFLDEVGELPPKLQVALLRVLQDGCIRPLGSRHDRTFAGRVVAATNADLTGMRASKQFRDDLYYRLAVIELRLPPLRERLEEIVPLAEQFVADACARRRESSRELSEEARSALQGYRWPGNVRELRNRAERACAMAKAAVLRETDFFPERALASGRDSAEHVSRTLEDARRRAEHTQIEEALLRSQGRIGEAAKQLGISRTTLWKRMKSEGNRD